MLNRPQRPSVFLKKLGKPIHFNFISIEDEDWLMERFPENTLTKDMEEGKTDSLLEIMWRLMDDDAKKLVASVKLTKWEGTKQVPVESDDPVFILKNIVSGANEIIDIWNGFLAVKVASMPEPVATEKKSPKAGDR